MENSLSLYELNTMIKKCLTLSFDTTIWVHAQISELRVNANGHCYLELVEKDSKNMIIARQRATIWANTFAILGAYFEQTTQMSLKADLEVLVGCSVEMHEAYGISLNITDISPEYTIGKIVLEKESILQRLREDGIINLNTSLPFPILPQRIAVISSRTAAGYEDFVHQIESNNRGYRFSIELFEARMQGEATETSVIKALDDIFEQADRFDIVVIIRGGGATADLSAFDNYNIAFRVAQFPLPVICGVGHQRDSTILDIIANKSVKTPTAAAELLIETFSEQEANIADINTKLKQLARRNIEINKQTIDNLELNVLRLPQTIIANEKQRLNRIFISIESRSKDMLRRSHHNISRLHDMLITETKHYINNQISWIKNSERNIALLSPESVIKRGYTMVKQNGKIVTSAQKLDQNKEFQIIFRDGTVKVSKQKGNL